MTCYVVPVYGVAAHAGSIEFFRACSVRIQWHNVGLIVFEMLEDVGATDVLGVVG